MFWKKSKDKNRLNTANKKTSPTIEEKSTPSAVKTEKSDDTEKYTPLTLAKSVSLIKASAKINNMGWLAISEVDVDFFVKAGINENTAKQYLKDAIDNEKKGIVEFLYPVAGTIVKVEGQSLTFSMFIQRDATLSDAAYNNMCQRITDIFNKQQDDLIHTSKCETYRDGILITDHSALGAYDEEMLVSGVSLQLSNYILLNNLTKQYVEKFGIKR